MAETISTDGMAAYLAEVRKHVAAIKAIRARWTPSGESIGYGMAGDWVVANLESASDVPPLLAALEQVLDIHYKSQRPVDSGPDKGKHWCVGCYRDVDHHILYTPWPCPTYRAISAALPGGGG